jgi:hypothetical protein
MEPEQKAHPVIACKTEWRRPELRKLPIAATAGSTAKGGVNSCDGTPPCPKQADASGQIS